MWTAGVAGLVLGASPLLLVPRFLPFSADSRGASLVTGCDRINAAYAMIVPSNPIAPED